MCKGCFLYNQDPIKHSAHSKKNKVKEKKQKQTKKKAQEEEKCQRNEAAEWERHDLNASQTNNTGK